VRPLTSTELNAWRTCPRGWWLTHYRCLKKKRDLPPLANVGTLYHAALEQYYEGFETLPADFIRGKMDALLEEYPELSDQIAKDGQLAVIMAEGYVEWVAETGADSDFDVVGAEVMVEAQVEEFTLRGKIDARLKRRSDGALLQLEHKTVGNLSDHPSWAQENPQFLNYDLLAYLTKPDGVPTDGLIVNMARRVKRTARANPPFYGRLEVRHNKDELRSHYRHVVGTGRAIARAREQLDAGHDHHLVCPPSPGRNHQWVCACAPIITMFDDGSDVESLLEELYEPWDPMGRYGEAA
jgi:RecB family exonuclease